MVNKIERVPLRDLIHRNLLERILRGLLPSGTRIKDTDISEQMNVSRTPVREALVRLVKEGFLENRVGRGFEVRPMTIKEAKEIYPIISALEVLALNHSKACPEAVSKRCEKISQLMAKPQKDFIRLIEWDMEWHELLLSGCDNQRLKTMIKDLKSIAFRYEYAFMQNADLVESSIREHREIMDAFSQEGPDSAAPLLERHWESSLDALLEKLEAETNKH